MKQPFQSVLFDLGVVMLHLNYERAREQLLPLCDPARAGHGQSFLSLLDRTHLVQEYELGHMTAEDFFGHFVEHTGFRGDFDTFAGIWRSIFDENAPMLEFGQALSRRFPIYFLTNASDLHVPWVFERFPSMRFFTGWICSCYIGALKPDRRFYEQAMSRFGLSPDRCLFVDDRPENIEGAEALGIRSVLYTEPQETIRRVAGLLDFA